MRIVYFLAAALFAAQPSQADASNAPVPTESDAQMADRPDVASVSDEDEAMNAAIAEAQRTLPEFLEMVASPPADASNIVFKFPLGGWEHIWVSDVAIDGDFLTGVLNNVPMQVGHAQGDSVRVPFSEVSDWAYRDADGLMHGHRTTRVLFPSMKPELAEGIKKHFGW